MKESEKMPTEKKKDRTIKFDLIADKLEFFMILLEQDYEELPNLYLKETKINKKNTIIQDDIYDIVNPYIIVYFKPIDNDIRKNLSHKLKEVFFKTYPTPEDIKKQFNLPSDTQYFKIQRKDTKVFKMSKIRNIAFNFVRQLILEHIFVWLMVIEADSPYSFGKSRVPFSVNHFEYQIKFNR
jgi:hypothetical protein